MRRVILRQHAHRLPSRVVAREAARAHHHAERRDERRNAGVGDEAAVHETGERAGGKTGRDRHDDRKIGERRKHRARVRRLREARGDHRRQRDDRSRREIDAAGEDHLRDADGQQPDDRDLQHHHEQALSVEEEARAANLPADRLEQHGDADEHEEDADVAREPACPQCAASLMRST